MLRGEGGVYYADLYPLISLLPRFSTPLGQATEDDMLPLWKASDMDYVSQRSIHSETTHRTRLNSSPPPQSSEGREPTEKDSWSGSSRRKRSNTIDPEMALPVQPSEGPLLPARNPPHSTLYGCFGLLRIFKLIIKPFSKRFSRVPAPPPTLPRARTFTGKKIKPELADSNVPVEIALFLTTYFASLMKQSLLAPASATAMNNAIVTLQDTVVSLERIKNTPLPFAYQAHLRISLWCVVFIYLNFILPILLCTYSY